MKLEKKYIIEILGAIAVLTLGIVLFLNINKREKVTSGIYPGYPIKVFTEAINNYRTGRYKRAEEILRRIIENEKNKKVLSIAYLYLGNIYEIRMDYKKALEFYNFSLKYNRKNYYALYNSAVLNLKKGHPDKAINICENIYRKWPELTINTLLLGNLYFSKAMYSDAARVYNKIKGSPIARFNLAMCYLKIGRELDAIEILNDIINSDSVSRILWGLSGIYLGSIEGVSISQRIKAFKLAMEVFPGTSDIKYNLALLKINNGDFKDAAELLFDLYREKKDLEVLYLYLYVLFKEGNWDRATEDIRMLSTGREESLDGIMGDFYLLKKQYKKAEEYYEKNLKQASVLPNVLYNLVSLYIINNNLDKAAELVSNIKKALGENFLYYLSLAKLNFSVGKKNEVYEDLASALKKANFAWQKKLVINSLESYGFEDLAIKLYLSSDFESSLDKQDYVESLLRVAEIYFKRGHREIALQFLNRIRNMVERTDDYYKYMVLRAECEINSGKKEIIYKRLIEEFPYIPDAYVNLSLHYAKSGQFKKALIIINRSFEKTNIQNNRGAYEKISIIKEFCEKR